MGQVRVLEHTGEVRLQVRGASLGEVLAGAARALGELEREGIGSAGGRLSRELDLRARDPAGLLVDWLNELVYLCETDGWVPERVEIHRADPTAVHATAEGPRLAAPPSLVKAATLHGARVEETGEGWEAEVVLDV